jgi:hypothetical protein
VTYISQSQFAKRCGCPQPNVNRAVRKGQLVDDGHGIDPDLPINAAWAAARVEYHAAKARAAAEKETERATVTRPGFGQKPPPSPSAHNGPRSGGGHTFGSRPESQGNDRTVHLIDARQKDIKASIEEIKFRKEKLSHLQRCGKVLGAHEYYRDIGRISAALEENFRTFADRHADQLEAMAKAGAGRTQFAEFLAEEIDKSVSMVQAVCDREVQESQERNIIDETEMDEPGRAHESSDRTDSVEP